MISRAAPLFSAHDDIESWRTAAVSDITTALQHDLDRNQHARLLVSGGTTPAPVYRALAKISLDWSRVTIALVDERWLPMDHADSNAHLIHETLLTDHAAKASFERMLVTGRGLQESVLEANRLFAPASVAVLGMGSDGHMASLFPRMKNLHEAMISSDDYVSVNAEGCPGAGCWPQRISLTPHGLSKTAQRILLIRGEEKRKVLERALDGADGDELPIRIALSQPDMPLRIHWCP